jgi:hypothetical protein
MKRVAVFIVGKDLLLAENQCLERQSPRDELRTSGRERSRQCKARLSFRADTKTAAKAAAVVFKKMVGTTGFEPATSRTPSVRATRLRHVPSP